MVRDYDCFDIKTRGASHIEGNLPCQDSCLSVSRDGYKLICVCDGHGGNDYFRSDRGSALATEIFASCVDEAGEDFLSGMDTEESVKDPGEPTEKICQRCKRIKRPRRDR